MHGSFPVISAISTCGISSYGWTINICDTAALCYFRHTHNARTVAEGCLSFSRDGNAKKCASKVWIYAKHRPIPTASIIMVNCIIMWLNQYTVELVRCAPTSLYIVLKCFLFLAYMACLCRPYIKSLLTL